MSNITKVMHAFTNQKRAAHLCNSHRAEHEAHVDGGNALFLGFEWVKWRHLTKGSVTHETYKA